MISLEELVSSVSSIASCSAYPRSFAALLVLRSSSHRNHQKHRNGLRRRMHRTCFLSLTVRQQCCGRSSSSAAVNDHYHLHTRRGDATGTTLHRYKSTRSSSSSSSSSYWSLQTQQDDNNPPRKQRRKRRQAKEITTTTDDDDDDNNSSAIYSFLFTPVDIPFSIGGTTNKRQTVPSLYLVATVATSAFLPTITWVLLVLFFGSYLVLLLPLLEEYDDIFSVDENEEDGERLTVAPLIAFTGAVASAALLSPQGLVLDDEKGGGLVSIPYLFATLVVAFGGYVLFMGVNDMAKDTQEWEREEIDALAERRERSVMNDWDDKLKDIEDSELN